MLLSFKFLLDLKAISAFGLSICKILRLGWVNGTSDFELLEYLDFYSFDFSFIFIIFGVKYLLDHSGILLLLSHHLILNEFLLLLHLLLVHLVLAFLVGLFALVTVFLKVVVGGAGGGRKGVGSVDLRVVV